MGGQEWARSAAGGVWRRMPPRFRHRLTRLRRWWSRSRPGRRVRWGNIRRSYPFSDQFGLDRGLPIDRVYIREFVGRSAGDIHGEVMEMSRSTYSDMFGGGQITSLTIVDIDAGNAQATLHCDLCEPGTLPGGRFDCIILTQTLQYLPDLGVALRNLWTALAPKGVLLVTVPALSRDDPIGADFWRFTPAGLRLLLSAWIPEAEIEVMGYGDALAGAASFLGLAAEDVGAERLTANDPAFPVIAGARVRRSRTVRDQGR